MRLKKATYQLVALVLDLKKKDLEIREHFLDINIRTIVKFVYLEEYYKGQFCSQDRPVLFREGVGMRVPRWVSVVLIPEKHRQCINKENHTLP